MPYNPSQTFICISWPRPLISLGIRKPKRTHFILYISKCQEICTWFSGFPVFIFNATPLSQSIIRHKLSEKNGGRDKSRWNWNGPRQRYFIYCHCALLSNIHFATVHVCDGLLTKLYQIGHRNHVKCVVCKILFNMAVLFRVSPF